jgi:Flavin reductase like domain
VPKEFAMKPFALSKVYQLLEPGPVVPVTTVRRGTANVMAMSWHMMVEFEPPQLACVVSNANYSFGGLRLRGYCRPSEPPCTVVVKVRNSSGCDTDKFTAFGLTKVPVASVTPRLISSGRSHRFYCGAPLQRCPLCVAVQGQFLVSVRDFYDSSARS